MKDRVVQHANRYKLTPVSGDIYDLTPEPGVVTEPGTPINKATLLKDDTASKFGQGEAATPDTVFSAIFGALKALGGGAVVQVTLKTSDNVPLGGQTILGISTSTGGACITNENGYAEGYTLTEETTISWVSPYVDVGSVSRTVSTPIATTTSVQLQASTVDFLRITTSQSFRFSRACTAVHVTCVGGGGGGGSGGGGGGGGNCQVSESRPFTPDTTYPAVVGSGGKGGDYANGGDGGATSFLGLYAVGGVGGNRRTMSGNSGVGGNGNGAGGSMAYPASGAGVPGSVYGYHTATTTVLYGGGGGAGGIDGGSRGSGAGYGGDGGGNRATGQHGTPTYGGGGGGGYYITGDGEPKWRGGDGGSGCISIKMEH